MEEQHREYTVPRRDNYKQLLSYQKAEAVYDLTYYFCHRFLDHKDRTIDQMVQAARSGKQNIVEGCAASATSAMTEIKLLNVAKASLRELLTDYEDYLRTRHLVRWEEQSAQAVKMRELGKGHNDSAFFMGLAQSRIDETIANMAIILLMQTDYLLYRQILSAVKSFEDNGGFRERLTRVRKGKRGF